MSPDNPAPNAYLRYRPEVEQTQPGEEEDVAALRKIFAGMREAAFEKHRHGLRDAHAKSHGVLRGALRIRDDPAELRQGMFAHVRELLVIIRFSTAPGDFVRDGIGAARVMAIKVLDVDGEKIVANEAQARTQDFLLVNFPTISSGDVHTYRRDQAPALRCSKRLGSRRLVGRQGRRFRTPTCSARRIGPRVPSVWRLRCGGLSNTCF